MLNVFAILPDVFQEGILGGVADQTCLLTFLKSVLDCGVMVDLNEMKWAHVESKLLPQLAPQLSTRIRSYLEVFKKQKRLISPKGTDTGIAPEHLADQDWVRLALGIPTRFNLHDIVVSQDLFDKWSGPHDLLVPLNMAPLLPEFQRDRQSILAKRTLSEFERLVGPALRLSSQLDLIDPNMVPEPRFTDVIQMCQKHIGQLLPPTTKVIRIHAGNARNGITRGPAPSPVERITLWEDYLSRLRQTTPLVHFRVYLWTDRGQNGPRLPYRLHDRAFVTDQAMISVEGGLDTGPGDTTFAIQPHLIRQTKVSHYIASPVFRPLCRPLRLPET